MTGTSTYPKSPKAVLRIIDAYKPSAGWGKCRQDAGVGTKEVAMFANKKNNHFYGKMGHIAPECPKRKGAAKEDQLHTNIQKVQEEEYDEVNINQGERKQLCTEKRERGVVNKIWI